MHGIDKRLDAIDWDVAIGNITEKGYTIITSIITSDECNKLIENYTNEELYRKTVVMERYRFGLGAYKYFNYPLPSLIQNIRTLVYPKLVALANRWMQELNINISYPNTLSALHQLCQQHNQDKPTILLLKYGQGGHNTLHQDLYGEIYFPMQLVLFLNEPDEDYTGGEFVLTQQIPRAQSKAIVLKPGKGDILIFTTNFRPVKGTRGYYRVNMKHGVSEVHTGERHTLGIIFHDALS